MRGETEYSTLPDVLMVQCVCASTENLCLHQHIFASEESRCFLRVPAGQEGEEGEQLSAESVVWI